MKVTEIWKSKTKPTVSFELFPARDEKAGTNLDKAIEKLAGAQPDFVSVTFGAGGSTREGSRDLIDKLHREQGLEVMGYFACYGLGPQAISAVLDSYRDTGVENVLAVRGDVPRDQEGFSPHPDSLLHASDLVTFIGSRWDFCVGVAGYPEGHIEAESVEKDLEYLELKVRNGAEYVIANYFYDNSYFLGFVERCRAKGIRVPIVPGIMPIISIKMMENLARLCGATITDEIRAGIADLPEGDRDALVDFGIDFASEQCRQLIAAGVPGLHIYTMDRSKSAVEIVRRLRAEDLL